MGFYFVIIFDWLLYWYVYTANKLNWNYNLKSCLTVFKGFQLYVYIHTFIYIYYTTILYIWNAVSPHSVQENLFILIMYLCTTSVYYSVDGRRNESIMCVKRCKISSHMYVYWLLGKYCTVLSNWFLIFKSNQNITLPITSNL